MILARDSQTRLSWRNGWESHRYCCTTSSRWRRSHFARLSTVMTHWQMIAKMLNMKGDKIKRQESDRCLCQPLPNCVQTYFLMRRSPETALRPLLSDRRNAVGTSWLGGCLLCHVLWFVARWLQELSIACTELQRAWQICKKDAICHAPYEDKCRTWPLNTTHDKVKSNTTNSQDELTRCIWRYQLPISPLTLQGVCCDFRNKTCASGVQYFDCLQ